MAKRKPEEPSGGLPEWLGTYGDMVTLLLCFFVLLFASSSINEEKFRQIAASFSGQEISFGGGGAGISDLLGSGILELPDIDYSINNSKINDDIKKKEDISEELRKMASEFKTYFAEHNLEESIKIEATEQYISLILPENVLFDSGSADLKIESLDVLKIIGDAVLAFPESNVIIAGHTDNVPISTAQYKNNRYLSSARADEVCIYFVNTLGIDPTRIVTESYADTRPVDTNATVEGRARNRRVEIKIISNYYSD